MSWIRFLNPTRNSETASTSARFPMRSHCGRCWNRNPRTSSQATTPRGRICFLRQSMMSLRPSRIQGTHWSRPLGENSIPSPFITLSATVFPDSSPSSSTCRRRNCLAMRTCRASRADGREPAKEWSFPRETRRTESFTCPQASPVIRFPRTIAPDIRRGCAVIRRHFCQARKCTH